MKRNGAPEYRSVGEPLWRSLREPLLFVLVAAGLLAGFAVALQAADITGGHTFADGDRVAASDMNAIVGSATINSAFYTGKSAVTTPGMGDSFLLYSVGFTGFRTITASNLLAAVNSVQFWSVVPSFTNLAQYTATPTNSDLVPIWNNRTNVMQVVTVSNLAYGVAAVLYTNYTSTAFVFTYGFKTNLAHGLPGVPQNVRWVLTCVSAEAQNGFNVGDELSVDRVDMLRTNGPAAVFYTSPAFGWGANSSNVFINCATNTDTYLANAYVTVGTNNGVNLVRLTNANWRLKCYSRYWAGGL